MKEKKSKWTAIRATNQFLLPSKWTNYFPPFIFSLHLTKQINSQGGNLTKKTTNSPGIKT